MTNSKLSLWDELRIIAQNGLEYADNPYDEERYDRILTLISDQYEDVTDSTSGNVKDRFTERLGHVTPNIGGLAATFNNAGEILLIKRADDGTWGLPGGYSESGENPAETAVRETREETGFEVSPYECVASEYRSPDRSNPHGFISLTYLTEISGGEKQLSHEVTAIDYWEIEAVPEWHKDHSKIATLSHRTWCERDP